MNKTETLIFAAWIFRQCGTWNEAVACLEAAQVPLPESIDSHTELDQLIEDLTDPVTYKAMGLVTEALTEFFSRLS